MADLTAIILTKNEEKNLADCIQSIRSFASRVLVVDSGSTDATCALAASLGAEVVRHDFSYYAQQFNWALDNCAVTTQWALRLDADERFTPAVIQRCQELMLAHAQDDVNGISMESDFFFLGRLMKHCGSIKRKIMVFKVGLGRIEDRKRDAHTILLSGRSVFIGQRFIHNDFYDLTSYVARYNWYTLRELADYNAYVAGASQQANTDPALMRHRKKKFSLYYRAPMFIRSWLWFMYKFYLRGGFLDGREGYIYNYLECYWYRFLVDAKIYEQRKLGTGDAELKALER